MAIFERYAVSLDKMYIYHTKYLMFNLSSCAKLNELC